MKFLWPCHVYALFFCEKSLKEPRNICAVPLIDTCNPAWANHRTLHSIEWHLLLAPLHAAVPRNFKRSSRCPSGLSFIEFLAVSSLASVLSIISLPPMGADQFEFVHKGAHNEVLQGRLCPGIASPGCHDLVQYLHPHEWRDYMLIPIMTRHQRSHTKSTCPNIHFIAKYSHDKASQHFLYNCRGPGVIALAFELGRTGGNSQGMHLTLPLGNKVRPSFSGCWYYMSVFPGCFDVPAPPVRYIVHTCTLPFQSCPYGEEVEYRVLM
jgi:hypothetical protein